MHQALPKLRGHVFIAVQQFTRNCSLFLFRRPPSSFGKMGACRDGAELVRQRVQPVTAADSNSLPINMRRISVVPAPIS